MDDGQWLDRATVDWLRRTRPRLADRPLLVVIAQRAGEGDHSGHGDRRPGSARPRGGHRAGRPARAADLHARSGGHPLFLMELMDASGEELRPPSGMPSTPGARRPDRRQRRCGPPPYWVRRSISIYLSAVLAEQPGVLLDHLEEGVRRHLLVESGQGFRFRHQLVREALHGSLSPSRANSTAAPPRACRPGAGGRTVRDRPPRPARCGSVLAARALATAAELAAARFDHDEALRLFDEALEQDPSAAIRLRRARAALPAGRFAEAAADAGAALAGGAGAQAMEVAAIAAYLVRDFARCRRLVRTARGWPTSPGCGSASWRWVVGCAMWTVTSPRPSDCSTRRGPARTAQPGPIVERSPAVRPGRSRRCARSAGRAGLRRPPPVRGAPSPPGPGAGAGPAGPSRRGPGGTRPGGCGGHAAAHRAVRRAGGQLPGLGAAQPRAGRRGGRPQRGRLRALGRRRRDGRADRRRPPGSRRRPDTRRRCGRRRDLLRRVRTEVDAARPFRWRHDLRARLIAGRCDVAEGATGAALEAADEIVATATDLGVPRYVVLGECLAAAARKSPVDADRVGPTRRWRPPTWSSGRSVRVGRAGWAYQRGRRSRRRCAAEGPGCPERRPTPPPEPCRAARPRGHPRATRSGRRRTGPPAAGAVRPPPRARPGSRPCRPAARRSSSGSCTTRGPVARLGQHLVGDLLDPMPDAVRERGGTDGATGLGDAAQFAQGADRIIHMGQNERVATAASTVRSRGADRRPSRRAVRHPPAAPWRPTRRPRRRWHRARPGPAPAAPVPAPASSAT